MTKDEVKEAFNLFQYVKTNKNNDSENLLSKIGGGKQEEFEKWVEKAKEKFASNSNKLIYAQNN